ncbi:Ig-like domain repeat protein [Streptomyces sp. NPDC058195]|uniref:Ig-like domain repeat protein n=1 Tax=Streptomyces sp. NPDC058195 TaxID=3346375 RepID=UPI0036E2318C
MNRKPSRNPSGKQHSVRIAATLVALTLGTAGLTALAPPVARAADGAVPGDTVAKLPMSSYAAMVVDSVHERVYVTDGQDRTTNNVVHIYNFEGQKTGSVSVGTVPSGMALSADSGTLYVSQSSAVLALDTVTWERTGAVATATAPMCPRDVAVAGGKPWHAETPYNGTDCAAFRSTLYGTADSKLVNTGWNAASRLRLESDPEVPDRFVMAQTRTAAETDPFVTTFDATGDTLVRGPQRRFADAQGQGGLDMKDVAQSPDGRRIAVADAAYGTRLLEAADLSDAPVAYQPLPEGATASAVAFSGDGTYIARGATATGGVPDLLVQPADPASGRTPLEFAFEGALDGDRVAPRGLGWSADGSRLFAVTTNRAGTEYWLHVIQPPAAQYDSRFTGGLSTTPGQPVVGEPAGIRGRLELDGPAPAEPVRVTAVRHDANGDRKLAAVEAEADGSFTVLDVPSLVGDATYTVSFTGDITHRPAEDVTLAVTVAKAPTTVTLQAPAEAVKSEGLTITGTLTGRGRALPAGITLSVVRTDRKGTGTLTSAAVAADGSFTVHDLPRAAGQVTYEIGYAGDELHDGATASATVRVRN